MKHSNTTDDNGGAVSGIIFDLKKFTLREVQENLEEYRDLNIRWRGTAITLSTLVRICRMKSYSAQNMGICEMCELDSHIEGCYRG